MSKKNDQQKLRDAKKLTREHEAKKSEQMISLCAEKVAHRMSELIHRQLDVRLNKELQKEIFSEIRKTMSVELHKMDCRGVVVYDCKGSLYDCVYIYECGSNHIFHADNALCKGSFNDFECEICFSCHKNFECRFSFDDEDCEGLFDCENKYQCVPGKDYNN
jgi:hypothetical protein